MLERGDLRAVWVAGDDAFGMSPSFRDGLAALGTCYVLDVPAGFTVWPPEPERTSPAYQGRGAPRKPRLVGGQRRTMAERSDELPEEAWREITVAEGSQGPRSYLFSAQRVRPTSRRKPGEIHWAIYRRNPDGSEPRYYLSNTPEDTPLETLAYVGGSRWRIETEFETEKSDVGLDEYETRTWAGWHHHVALCLLGGASLLSLQQAWGEKDAPDYQAAGLPGGAGNAAVARGYARMQRTGQALPCQAPRRPSCIPGHPSLNRRCNTRSKVMFHRYFLLAGSIVVVRTTRHPLRQPLEARLSKCPIVVHGLQNFRQVLRRGDRRHAR